MKKFTFMLAMLMAVFTPLAFVGCDDDDDIADTLWGVWEGDMYVTTEWHGHTYRASYSVIQFDKDPYDYASGTGYWVDYFSNAPRDYYASHIQWKVYDRNIYIYSIEDDTYFYIYDYNLSDNMFTGYIEDEDGNYQEFRLQKTSSPYWDGFDWGWDDWYGYSSVGSRNAKGRAAGKGGDVPVRKIRPAAATHGGTGAGAE